MKDCEKNFERWVDWIVGEGLSRETRQNIESHLADCGTCVRLYDKIEGLLRALRQEDRTPRAEDFFLHQRESILRQVSLCEDASGLSPKEEALLTMALQRVRVAQPEEGFFTAQRDAVLQKISQEEQAFERRLGQVSCQDPGELFFRRQRQQILSLLPLDESSFLGSAWRRGLVAAAMFVLIVGASWFWKHDFSSEDSQDWRQALSFLAQDEKPDPLGPWVELEDLSEPQLELLAKNISGRAFFEDEEILVEDSQDWDDFDDFELENLIQHLKEKA